MSQANDKEVYERTFLFVPSIPLAKVFTADGRVIGTAAVELAEGGVKAKLFLDKHTPEAFELETEPSRVRVNVSGTLFDGKLSLTVYFE